MEPKPCECDGKTGRATHVNLSLLIAEVNRLEMEYKDAEVAYHLASEVMVTAMKKRNCVLRLFEMAKQYVEVGEYEYPDL